MKKLLIFLSIIGFFIGIKGIYAEECNTYYKIKISIEGNGSLKIYDSDKSYTKDATVTVKCNDSLVFNLVPEDDYSVKGVYIDGEYVYNDKNFYNLTEINSNMNLKIFFGKEEKNLENENVYISHEGSYSLYFADTKENLDKDLNFKFNLKEVTILFDNEFIKNSADFITLTASELYKNSLGIKEQKAVKNSLCYQINLYNGDNINNKINGFATISIPYSKSKKAYVYRFLKDGKITYIDSELKDGNIVFKVDELGKFAISSEELDELNYVRNIINLNNKQKIAVISIGFALSLLIVFIKIKKRK